MTERAERSDSRVNGCIVPQRQFSTSAPELKMLLGERIYVDPHPPRLRSTSSFHTRKHRHEIECKGDLTYEVHLMTKRLPEPLVFENV